VQRRPGGYYGGGGGGMGFGFAVTPMVRNLMVANAIVWVLQQGGFFSTETFALSVPGVVEHNRIYQLFTYMWLHGPPMHLFFNMLSLWMFGPQLEQIWGPQRFLRFYMICGLGAGVLILLWNAYVRTGDPTLGASGAIFGVLTAFSLLWPDRQIMLLFPPVPLRALYFIPFLFLMTLVMPGGDNISHVGHLGGVLTAGVLMRDELRRALNLTGLRYRWNRYRMRGRLRTIQRDEWERRRRSTRDDDGPTLH
jgi:membrane associated rhomboid family serine protease